MSMQWDLETYDRDNQLVLVVEVKSILDKPPGWAARLRRNILAHGTFPNAPYLLMDSYNHDYSRKCWRSNKRINKYQ